MTPVRATAALFCLVACSSSAPPPTGAPAPGAASDQPKRVRTVVLEARSFERTSKLSGNIVADRKAAITPLLPGQIAKIYVKAGEDVRRGDRLYRIVGTDYWMGTEHAVAQKLSSAALVDQARTQVVESERAYRRFERLRRDKAIPEAEFEAVEAKLKFSRDQLRLAESQVRLADVGTRLARSKVGETLGYAPFDGRVIERLMEEGEVARTMPPSVILAIVALDVVHAEGALLEADLGATRLGETRIDVHVPAIRPEPFTAKLTFISPLVDAVTRTVKVRAEIKNPDKRLLPGMSANLVVNLARATRVAVPREALTRIEHRSAQLFVVKDGVARLREVELAERDGVFFAVVRGVSAGERVVVAGHVALIDGAKVVE